MSQQTKSFVMCVVVLATIGWAFQWFSATAKEEDKKPKSGAREVAVIDMGQAFKQHNDFREAMEKVKKDFQVFAKKLNTAKAEIQDLNAQLKLLEPGTAAHATLERQIARDAANLQADSALKKKEWMNREAAIFAETYRDIKREVARFARANKIGLVLRYSSEPMDEEQRDSVLKGVNKTVVFQDQIDITDDIIRAVNTKRKIELN